MFSTGVSVGMLCKISRILKNSELFCSILCSIITINFSAVSIVLGDFKISSSLSEVSSFFSIALLVNSIRSGKMPLEIL